MADLVLLIMRSDPDPFYMRRPAPKVMNDNRPNSLETFLQAIFKFFMLPY